jgi:hypothetical protein
MRKKWLCVVHFCLRLGNCLFRRKKSNLANCLLMKNYFSLLIQFWSKFSRNFETNRYYEGWSRNAGMNNLYVFRFCLFFAQRWIWMIKSEACYFLSEEKSKPMATKARKNIWPCIRLWRSKPDFRLRLKNVGGMDHPAHLASEK